VIYDRDRWDKCLESIELMRKSMPDDLEGVAKYTIHSAKEAQTTFHCNGDTPMGAIKSSAGSLSAYKLVIGMLKLCLNNRLNLQTNTPATSLEKSKDGFWTVGTARGSIKAQQVVLATNGYTANILKDFQGVIVPQRGQLTAHRPGANMPKQGLPTTYSFLYSNGYEYMIPRPQGSKFAGDIVIGGGYAKAKDGGTFEFGTTDDTTLDPKAHDWLVQTTPHYFGSSWGTDHPEGRIRNAWSGIMGETK
jgi:glycine/D-amino acid oxidase-like deaminating enzyme